MDYQNLTRKERRGMKSLQGPSRSKTIIIWAGIIIVSILAVIGLAFLSQNSQPAKGGSAAVKVGDLAPDFNLPSQLGGSVSLADFKEKKNVLLYFHEGITCDPCWEQIPELERNLKELEDMNVALVSITVDPVDSIKKRAVPYGIKTPVLSADATEIDKKYDVDRYSMAMKVSGGMAMNPSEDGIRPGHTFILVDTNGMIVWRKDYYDGFGMGNVPNGKMFVKASEIISEVKNSMRQ